MQPSTHRTVESSRLEPSAVSSNAGGTAEAIERGHTIAHDGIPNKRVPACVGCHGPGPIERNPVYRVLSGQYANYLVLQLELFKNDHRGGTEYAHVMRMVAGHLTAEQAADVASYYASLRPGPRE